MFHWLNNFAFTTFGKYNGFPFLTECTGVRTSDLYDSVVVENDTSR